MKVRKVIISLLLTLPVLSLILSCSNASNSPVELISDKVSLNLGVVNYSGLQLPISDGMHIPANSVITIEPNWMNDSAGGIIGHVTITGKKPNAEPFTVDAVSGQDELAGPGESIKVTFGEVILDQEGIWAFTVSVTDTYSGNPTTASAHNFTITVSTQPNPPLPPPTTASKPGITTPPPGQLIAPPTAIASPPILANPPPKTIAPLPEITTPPPTTTDNRPTVTSFIVPFTVSPGQQMNIQTIATDDIEVAQINLYDSTGKLLQSFKCPANQKIARHNFTVFAPSTQLTVYSFSADVVDNAGQSSDKVTKSGKTTQFGGGGGGGGFGPPKLTITTSYLPSGIVDAAYRQSLTPYGGISPYSWNISVGSPPPGLSLSDNVISGSPTMDATYNFTVQVKDNVGATSTQPMTIKIYPPNKGYRFLEDNLNPSLNLICESPDTGSIQDKTYWLLSDNFLASYALKMYDPKLSKLIMATLEKYGYIHDHYIEILFGSRTTEPIYAIDGDHPRIIIKADDYQILTDNLTSNRMDDYAQYLDKLCYESLWEAYGGNRQRAETLYNQALKMWDGKGFNDKGFQTHPENGYATYKLAVFYYTARVLGKLDTLAFKDTLLSTMYGLQAPNGGFRTSYYYDGNGKLQSQSSTNTETTSLTLIALYYDPKPLPP